MSIQIDNLNSNNIRSMCYPDFIALVNQWNVCPGAYSTLSKWAIFSGLSFNSYLLELGCSTGFSSRELALLTGCKGVALDINKPSIEMAKYNLKTYAPNVNIDYICEDGYKFVNKTTFSHIVIGAALKFFPNPNRMFKKMITMLKDEGFVLASPFYVIKPIPNNLVDKAKKIFGFTITTESYKEIMAFYGALEIIFEERNDLIQETEEELKHYCNSTIDRACKIRGINNKELYETMYKRLYEIKRMSNELRPYQNYSVLVLRHRKLVYPKRFVELF